MMINQGMWNDNPFDSWTEEEEHLSNMGVISFGKGGPPPTPAHTTTQTTSQYPDELKPFIQDIFGKAKGIEDQRSSQGYQAYDAPRIAGFNQDQQNAFTGIRDAQGASTPYFEAQETLIDRSTAGPSAARTAQYMNPYTQNVIDIQQRELGRMGAQERQRIGAGAVGAGGYGGSRQAILEAEQMRNQGMRSDDIQAKGMNQAFAQAQQAMAQADARGLQGAGMYGQMATQVPGQRMKELGALAGVGAADQTQQQRALDLGYRQFQDEYNYPMKTLNDYSAILRGFPLPPSTSTNQTAYSAVAPLSSQLLGAGAGLTGMAGMAGLFGASGGQVKKLQQGGLASMYAPSNRVEFGKTNYADVGDRNKERKLIEDSIRNLRDLNQTDISGFDRQDNETEIRKLKDSFAFNFGPLSSKFQKEYKGIYGEEDYLRDKDRERKEEYQEFRTPEGEAEIEEMNKAMERTIQVDEKKEKEDTLDDRRKRMAIWGPLLKNARGIAESETLGGALLGGLETAGEAMQGSIAADEAVIGRAAALRTAQVQEAMDLAGISKKLSKDELRIAFLDAAASAYDPQMKEKFFNAVAAIDESDMGPALEADIGSLLNPYIGLGSEAIPIAPAPAQKEGGPVKLAKGGTPERSFDFIPKDGKLIAVPK
jgi:hypothetical protein